MRACRDCTKYAARIIQQLPLEEDISRMAEAVHGEGGDRAGGAGEKGSGVCVCGWVVGMGERWDRGRAVHVHCRWR